MKAALRLGITLGDPAGVGPEISERAAAALLGSDAGVELCFFGPTGVVEPLVGRLGGRTSCVAGPSFAGRRGEPSAASGAASLWALHQGIDAAKAGRVAALVTAPISKTALKLAGSKDPGHTEILAREAGKGPVAMAFIAPRLRVVLVTTHMGYAEVPKRLSAERVVEVARLLSTALHEDFAVERPRLALAGLNPHAGEGGLFGDEEERLLAPAVIAARGAGIELHGPLPADTLFRRAVDGEFDGVVALYHDQGLIPVKLLAPGEAVNLTLGLSIIRTSPDHGTAYDKVGSEAIRHDGMEVALRLAFAIAAGRSGAARR